MDEDAHDATIRAHQHFMEEFGSNPFDEILQDGGGMADMPELIKK